MAIDYSCPEGAVPHKENSSHITIRVDADSMLLCDGDYIDQQFKAGTLTKIQLPPGQHLLEFLYTENPDIKVEKEVDFPEAGKSYLVIIKGLKDLVDAAADEARRKAEAEAKRIEEIERNKLYDLVLVNAGNSPISKMRLTKVVMDATGLSLSKSKERVESAPCVIKKSISKPDAEFLKMALEEAGAKVEIK